MQHAIGPHFRFDLYRLHRVTFVFVPYIVQANLIVDQMPAGHCRVPTYIREAAADSGCICLPASLFQRRHEAGMFGGTEASLERGEDPYPVAAEQRAAIEPKTGKDRTF